MARVFALHPAEFAQFMVSVRLMAGMEKCRANHGKAKWILPRAPHENAGREGRRRMGEAFAVVLSAVLLDARGAQAGEAMLIDRILPGEEFFDRECIAAAGFLQR
jgi:hypothetical protein